MSEYKLYLWNYSLLSWKCSWDGTFPALIKNNFCTNDISVVIWNLCFPCHWHFSQVQICIFCPSDTVISYFALATWDLLWSGSGTKNTNLTNAGDRVMPGESEVESPNSYNYGNDIFFKKETQPKERLLGRREIHLRLRYNYYFVICCHGFVFIRLGIPRSFTNHFLKTLITSLTSNVSIINKSELWRKY